jgi:hypothetical protein
MSAMSIPKTAIQAIDRRRRAFFWTGEDSCHGSKCLVAWDSVQTPKAQGGLGVKDLEIQNRCLLMKFVDKIFSAGDAPWKSWLLSTTSPFDASSTNGGDSFLWKIVNQELSTYRSLTYVNVHNGASTAFWLDHWLPEGPLYLSRPALFSHTTRPNVSVQKVFQTNFELHLRPRLTNVASSELASLLSCLQVISLDEAHDQRLMKLTRKCYATKDAYAALVQSSDPPDVHGLEIWASRVPHKVKIFSWLYFKDRLSTRVNLHSKHVLDSPTCERCSRHSEDRRHVFFDCDLSASVWRQLQLNHVGLLGDEDIWSAPVPPRLDAKMWSLVLQTILWRLWDARNGKIFRAECPSARSVITRICDDLTIWRRRLKDDHSVNSLVAWRNHFSLCNSDT